MVEDAKGPWLIELPVETIQNESSFASNDKPWPTHIERGWIEYIQVRYGRNLQGGVQESRKTDAKRE